MNWEKSNDIPQIGSADEILVVYGNHRNTDLALQNLILTDDEVAFANRLKVAAQKNTWISSRITLRKMLGAWLQMNPKEIALKINRFGRLSLADSVLYFNISHTDSSFLLGFSFNGKIGVDLDKLKGAEDLNALIEFAFSDQETEYCRNGILSERFLEIWTLKEAFLKAAGVGLLDNLKGVNIYGSANNQIRMKDLSNCTFICPCGETASLVYKNDLTIQPVWLS